MFFRRQEPAATKRDGHLVTLIHPVPTLTGTKSDWLNTEKPITFTPGNVSIVHFWTFGCINCKRNLPHYQSWWSAYRKEFSDGRLQMVGVHTPELEDERKFERVVAEVKKNKIEYPVLIDPKEENWKRWQQSMWPTVYLIDKQQRVRYYWNGELEWQGAGGYKKLTRFIEELLIEKGPPAKPKP